MNSMRRTVKLMAVSVRERKTVQLYCDFTKEGGGRCLSVHSHGGYSSQLLEEQGGTGCGSAG